VEAVERLWRSDLSSYIRVLPQALGVVDRGYTRRLERAITDFGCEHSFATAVGALQEHYGFAIPVTAARGITYRHADRIAQQQQEARPSPLSLPAEGTAQLVAEADGSMIAIVQTSGRKSDRRKNREIDYREVRLCACQTSGTASAHYEATFGPVDQMGKLWATAAKEAGRGLNTRIHVVSDGAVWIQKQAEVWLSPQRHLLDFYHVCEYLGEAAPPGSSRRWLSTQKKRLKTNRYDRVLDALKPQLEEPVVPDELAPVRRACRYLNNRLDQLDYAGAMAEKLPIGSGLIESGHRHVIQSRLKIAGASWSIENAEKLIQARTTRANRKWESYWNHN
jgi:hypothetical protein